MEQRALTLIRRGLCLSRAELARTMQISRPTASLVAEKLLALHAIRESGRGTSHRGKSPTLLAPEPAFQYTIGLDLGYDRQLAGVLLDGRNQIVRKAESGFDPASLTSIRECSQRLIRELSGTCRVSALGVAIAGIVEPQTERVLNSINPLFAECDLKQLFAAWTGLPLILENRSRAAAFSEACGGAADQQKNFVLCSLGKSIGSAFWLNGRLYLGTHGAAGEIRGLRLKNNLTFEEALSAEHLAGASEEELVAICADGLRQLTQIMDLDFFVLTGRFTDFPPAFPQKLQKALSGSRECVVVYSAFGRFSAARGAAASMAEKSIAEMKN